MEIHTDIDKPYKCDKCLKSFKSKSGLVYHKNVHSRKLYHVCQVCKRPFKRHVHLLSHIKAKHEGQAMLQPDTNTERHNSNDGDTETVPQTKITTYTCEICGKTLKYTSMKMHMLSHTGEKQFFCEQCGKGFYGKYKCSEHMKIHAVDNPYKCDQCCKSFKAKSSLVYHKNVHLGLKRYVCQVCKRPFIHRGHLLSHTKSQHYGDGMPQPGVNTESSNSIDGDSQWVPQTKSTSTYVCEVCGKRVRYTSLKQHIKRHTGQKQVVSLCEQCGKGFYSTSDYNAHMRKHTGDKPYKCDQCYKSFRIREYLNEHLLTHSKLKPFECQICKKTYRQRNGLRYHTKRQHNGRGMPRRRDDSK